MSDDERDEEDRGIILRRRALLLATALGGLGLAVAAPDAGSTPCPVCEAPGAQRGAQRRPRARGRDAGTADAADGQGADATPALEGPDEDGEMYDPQGIAGPVEPTRTMEIELPPVVPPMPCLSPPHYRDDPPGGGCGCGRRRVPSLS